MFQNSKRKNITCSLFASAAWDEDVVQVEESNDAPKCKLLERIMENKVVKCKKLASNNLNSVNPISCNISKRKKRQLKKMQTILEVSNKETKADIETNSEISLMKNVGSQMSFREKLWEKLKGSRFRYLNEQMYTSKGNETKKMFEKDPSAFEAYHEGFRHQVMKWPLNPLDIIIDEIKRMPASYIVADFGCGEAKLATSVQQTVKSFDLVALNKNVIACDMANVPLKDNSIDVAVYCLSLMGVNIKDYLLEASRVLKMGGILKIAEVASRFNDLNDFINSVSKYGFKVTGKNVSHEMFYFINFKKVLVSSHKSKLPKIELKSCPYKKR